MDHLHDANLLERALVDKANQSRVPITTNFELTPTCTLNCDMCFIRTERSVVERHGGLSPLQQWLDWAEQLQDMGTLFILLTGGEPMLYPHFKELYTRLREMGFILTLNTNGTLIDNEMVRILQTHKPRRINVTLYGDSRETYGRLCHNPQGYTLCMEALKRLKKADIDVKLNVSIVRKNEKDYDEIIRLAQHLDIPAEVNSYMFPLSRPECGSLRNILTERLDADEAARIEMQYMEYKKGNDMARYMHDLKYTLAHVEGTRACSLECRAAKSSCWINWQGILTPCVMLDQPAVDLKKIPMTTAWQQLLEEAKELVSHTECEGCHLRPVCNVCYAAAHCEKTITGSMDYLCQMCQYFQFSHSPYIAKVPNLGRSAPPARACPASSAASPCGCCIPGRANCSPNIRRSWRRACGIRGGALCFAAPRSCGCALRPRPGLRRSCCVPPR